MTGAFITVINSELQPDPNEETAALLRVLIYKIDNTTFGDDVPTIPPQWTGPPHTIVQVQALLYASLAASLFSAFLAMLGKQWLNRYMSTDMRGTAIERSQNRQRKLNGIVTWYFDYVMESLPMMLQVALLLLGCALSRYLWEIDTTVASVILGVTSLGVLFYVFIVIAGSASASCPYQTPGSRILRSAPPAVASAFRTSRRAFTNSKTIQMFQLNVEYYRPWWSRDKIMGFLRDILVELLPALASDGAHLRQALFKSLMTFVRKVYTWLSAISSIPIHGPDHQTTLLDLHCISWILQTSLDRDHHLSAMEHLVTMVALPDFDPSLVTWFFDALTSCIKVVDDKVMVTQGLEKLATLSATCLLHTFSHLSVMAPSSGVLADTCQKYTRIFPYDIEFNELPFCHTFGAIHCASLHHAGYLVQGRDYGSFSGEYIIFSHALTKLAQSEYQRRKRIPDWILGYVLYILSLHPLPSITIANCLTIIAISLDCGILNLRDMTLDERYAHV